MRTVEKLRASMIKTYYTSKDSSVMGSASQPFFFVSFPVNFLPGLAVFIIPSRLIHLTGVTIIKIGHIMFSFQLEIIL